MPAAKFTSTLQQAPGKQATGIVVPAEVIEQLNSGKKPPVRVTVNGYDYRTTIGIMAGQAMIPVSAAIRKDAGLEAGDHVEVELVVDATPRSVEVPEDLATAFAANPTAGVFFDSLSNSLQRYHVDNINAAKTTETKQRRVENSVRLFLDGKQR